MTIGQLFQKISETKGSKQQLCKEAEKRILLHKESPILFLCLNEARKGRKGAYLGKLIPPDLETEDIFWIKPNNMKGLIACWAEPQ